MQSLGYVPAFLLIVFNCLMFLPISIGLNNNTQVIHHSYITPLFGPHYWTVWKLVYIIYYLSLYNASCCCECTSSGHVCLPMSKRMKSASSSLPCDRHGRCCHIPFTLLLCLLQSLCALHLYDSNFYADVQLFICLSRCDVDCLHNYKGEKWGVNSCLQPSVLERNSSSSRSLREIHTSLAQGRTRASSVHSSLTLPLTHSLTAWLWRGKEAIPTHSPDTTLQSFQPSC